MQFQMKNKKGQLIVALDVDTFEEARVLVDSLSSVVDIFKVGSQLFTACGPEIVRYIQKQGKKIFLDLKYHDIPNTVSYSTSGAIVLSSGGTLGSKIAGQMDSSRGLFMLTVHISGGPDMLKAAVKAAKDKAEELNVKKPYIVGVTVLTSEAKTDMTDDIILERARLAKQCGLDGVVASSQEAAAIRREMGDDFIIVTPGIRPSGSASDDQQRISTPREAVKNGSHFLVVGRPIVKAENPLLAAKEILKEIQ